MHRWRRRLRGALGIGLLWSVAWLAAGLVMLVIVGFGAADVPFPLFWALLGFLGGVAFSAILGVAEGRRRFDEMSLPRFAAWGGAGGLVLAAGLSAVVGPAMFPLLGVIFALAGGGCASGTLALARMAEEPAAPATGPDAATGRAPGP
jgi:hypothetical protein